MCMAPRNTCEKKGKKEGENWSKTFVEAGVPGAIVRWIKFQVKTSGERPER